MTALTIKSLTDIETTPGTDVGNLGKLLETITLQLEEQFTKGRITGTDYANVYLGAIQAVIQQSVAYTLGMAKTNAEVALLTQKEITEWGQTQLTTATGTPAGVIGKQMGLFTEQAKGFYNSAKNKHMKAVLDTYSVKMSVNKTGDGETLLLKAATDGTGVDKVIADGVPTA